MLGVLIAIILLLIFGLYLLIYLSSLFFLKDTMVSVFKMNSPDVPLWSQIQPWFTSSFWGNTILTIIIALILFLLFAPYICKCVTRFVSNHMKTFKLQTIVLSPTVSVVSSSYYLGPLDKKP